MKLEVGMYVRTSQGYIAKYLGEYATYNMDGEYEYYYEFDGNIAEPYYGNTIPIECCSENMFIKQSHNIIDLIEVGDYVNGYLIIRKEKTLLTKQLSDIEPRDIKSIVTKEQIESMSYKVGE